MSQETCSTPSTLPARLATPLTRRCITPPSQLRRYDPFVYESWSVRFRFYHSVFINCDSQGSVEMSDLQDFDDPALDVLVFGARVERQEQRNQSYEETNKQTDEREKWEVVEKVGEGAFSRVHLHRCIERNGVSTEGDGKNDVRAVKTIYVANDAPYDYKQEIKVLLFFSESKVKSYCLQNELY
jgi:hypothetical protein